MAIADVRAEVATFWPSACVCGAQKGPFVDTGIERHGERIYLCSLCTKIASVTLGFIQGPEFDKLENAAGELHDLTLDRDRLRERIVLLEAARRERNERIAELSEELDVASGRVAQLEQTLRDVREATLAKVGDIPIEDEASAREVSPVVPA